ncbi:MAG: c-type cytochrome domain-containing protein, partial [Planctomycetaceae bacterium]
LTLPVDHACAQTPEQRKELQAVQKKVSAVAGLVRKREYEAAEKSLVELNAEAEKLIAAAGFTPGDRMVASLRRLLATNRQRVAKALGKPDPTLISFSKQVAPILAAKCGNCHGANNPRGGLNLSNFAGMRAGGASRLPLVTPKNPQRSLLAFRLATSDPQKRMPKNGTLTAAEIQSVMQWISQGAQFDGKDQTRALADLGKEQGGPGKPAPRSVVINTATGDEKVSFTRDIAPTIVNLCSRCHGGNDPRAGLSVATFESLMRGSENGRVIVPGSLEGSRLWALVGAGEQPRMPQGQARITRKFHADLRTWIEEGARFDGADAKAALRSLVPTEEEAAMEKLASLSEEEMRALREKRTAAQWKRVNPRIRPRFLSSPEFLVYGDVDETRMKQVSDWAEAHAGQLRKLFGIKQSPVWRGRLTVFVMKDRFGYTEFNQVIHSRSTARDVHGHAQVTPGFEDAYVVLEDVGDEAAGSAAGLKVNLIDHITGAYLSKPGTKLPGWVVRGTGLAMAARSAKDSTYISSLSAHAMDALKGISGPEDVFSTAQFGPSDIGPVGYTLVKYMIDTGGASRFGRFILQLQSGASVSAAVKAVYPPADLRALGTGYLQDLTGGK